jgi:hypothetical protein
MMFEFSDRDAAQVLAALRNWQTDSLNEDLVDAFAGHFEDHEPLTDEEIDGLCERINFGAPEGLIHGAAY